jgi:hypothetical protein
VNEYIRISGHRKYATYEHTVIAEKVLGKELPKEAEVHHVDGDKSNNAHHNLIICPDSAYHKLLHRRQKALDACGNADWIKCTYCKKHDDPKNLTVTVRRVYGSQTYLAYHKSCNTEIHRKYLERTLAL